MTDTFDIILQKIEIYNFLILKSNDNQTSKLLLAKLINGNLSIKSNEIVDFVKNENIDNYKKIFGHSKFILTKKKEIDTINLYKSAMNCLVSAPTKLHLTLNMTKQLQIEFKDMLNYYKNILYTHIFCCNFLKCKTSESINIENNLLQKINESNINLKQWTKRYDFLKNNILLLSIDMYKIPKKYMYYPFANVIDATTTFITKFTKVSNIIFEIPDNDVNKYISHIITSNIITGESYSKEPFLSDKLTFNLDNCDDLYELLNTIKTGVTKNKISIKCFNIGSTNFICFKPVTNKIFDYIWFLLENLKLSPQKINMNDENAKLITIDDINIF